MNLPQLAPRVAALVIVLAAPALAASTLDSLLHHHAADDLVVPLRRYENEAPRPREGAEAAMMLGQLHYARGEYRRAAEAFSRAAARLDPGRKTEARYWTGMSWLALGDHGQARATFDEIAEQNSPRQNEARFGQALAEEEARHSERAFEILEPLAREARGEVAPAILERTIALADRFKQAGVAEAARRRLFREYPRSIEAARAGLVPVRTAVLTVEIGPFPSEPLAHAAAERALQAGFTAARATIRGEGAARAYVVRLGEFESEEDARQTADRAKRELHVPAKVVTTP